MDSTVIQEGIGIAIALLGGLGLFLYGMNIMSNGLEKAAGSRMEKIIEKMSGNIFMGVIVGALVTVIIQSSSATTVMVVGFVNAGIMNLVQAIGIIMGANIGTTITAQLVSLDVVALAPISIATGMGIMMFAKKAKTKTIGEILLGFGILFLGMDMMKVAMKPLAEFEGFKTLILTFGDGTLLGGFKGFLLGFAMTAIMQSSSATTSILVALASTGALPIEAAFPILMGTNVGTCVTAMISSAGATRTAKRAALMHLLFNVIGTVIFALAFVQLTEMIVTRITDDPARQLANAHTLFNITTTLILLPFAKLIVRAVEKIIPITDDELEEKSEFVMGLDDRFLETPSIAVGQAVKQVENMGALALKAYDNSVKALKTNDRKYALKTFKQEKNINKFENDISDFLIKLSNTTSIANSERTRIDSLFSTINDIERVGDHADNLAELAIYKIENDLSFSEKGIDELEEMVQNVRKSFSDSMTAFENEDYRLAQSVVELESQVDQLEKDLRKKHIRRLNEGKCETKSGIVFLDMLSNLERVSDHASNIALAVLDTEG